MKTSAPCVFLAFAESPAVVRSISDDTGATPTQDWDQALNITMSAAPTFYTTPQEESRGGFRFLTITAFTYIAISNTSCTIGFAPNTPDLRAYSGHLYSPDDDLLVRIWYASAYTVQTNIAPKHTGRWLPPVRPGWACNNSIGVAGPLLVNSAKRDRAVWLGDLGIACATALLALCRDGLEAVRDSLGTLFLTSTPRRGDSPLLGRRQGSSAMARRAIRGVCLPCTTMRFGRVVGTGWIRTERS